MTVYSTHVKDLTNINPNRCAQAVPVSRQSPPRKS